MSSQPAPLYQAWQKIYPRHQPGFFRRLRWALSSLFLATWVLLPLLRWDRGEHLPNQAILFDLPARKFFMFDLTVWPQDVYLLAVLLIIAAVGLFFMTALAGRVFCGYMCFQTVWTDLFLLIEKIFEGNRKQRIKLDESPWGWRKLAIKLGKHAAWLMVSTITGAVFVFYFADAPTIFKEFLTGSAPTPAWVTLGFLTASTYAMAGFAREQVCIYMCPYSRFQGAMVDQDSLIVAYHPELGEPREGNRRLRQQPETQAGACIDCRQCVTTCPTGIDIRNGQQYECITCAACIDACDEVMAKLGSNTRLIRYTSMREMEGQPTQYWRARLVVYGLIMLVLSAGIVLHFALRKSVDLNVIRQRQPVYITQSNGAIQNNYTLRLLNLSTATQRYRLKVTGLPGAMLAVAASQDQEPVLTVNPGEVMPFTVYVRQPQSYLSPGQTNIQFVLEPMGQNQEVINFPSVFMRPQ